MALRYLTGDRLNILPRAVAAGLIMDSSDSLFLVANLLDGDPGTIAKYGSLGPHSLDADLNTVVNGDFESAFVGGLPAAATTHGTWGQTVAATLTRNTTNPQNGAGCLQVDGSAGTDSAYYDVSAKAGEVWRLFAGYRGRSGGTAAIRVQNQTTLKWLTSGAAWQAAAVDVVSTTGTSYLNLQLTFTVESFALCGADNVTLRVFFRGDSGAAAPLYDNFYFWPWWNFISIHGHNAPPSATVTISTGMTSPAGTASEIMAVVMPSMYRIIADATNPAATPQRYLRLQHAVTAGPLFTQFMGELVVGQVQTALRSQLWGYSTRTIFDQIRTATEAGNVRSYKRALFERRAVQLQFKLISQAQFEQQRDEWARQSFGGHFPMIVVPEDTDPSVVIHGRMTEESEIVREFAVWTTSVVIAESGFPTVTG